MVRLLLAMERTDGMCVDKVDGRLTVVAMERRPANVVVVVAAVMVAFRVVCCLVRVFDTMRRVLAAIIGDDERPMETAACMVCKMEFWSSDQGGAQRR